jgi:hypothetical protein
VAALRIEKLQRGHGVDTFDCGREALNRFLIRFALQNQQAGASQTYIALADEEVAGYYSPRRLRRYESSVEPAPPRSWSAKASIAPLPSA